MAVSVCRQFAGGAGFPASSAGKMMPNSSGRSLVGFTSTGTSSNQDEELAIRITIPPKPEGMNPGPYPTTHEKDGSESATFKISSGGHDSMNDGALSLGGSTGGIGLKSLLSHEEDLASSKLPFVWKLYEMLEEVEKNDQEDIVSWVEDGKAFKVHKMKAFVNDIIPHYFRQSKYKSFQRQLYFYDFHRIASGPNAGAYKHPNFVKGVKTLCLAMMPKKTARRRSSSKIKEDASTGSEDEASHHQEEASQGAAEVVSMPHSDPSEWMTQHQVEDPTAHGSDPTAQHAPREQHRRYSTRDYESVGPVDLVRSYPSDGEMVFVFGDRPFHFLEAEFPDIYPPSSSRPAPSHRAEYPPASSRPSSHAEHPPASSRSSSHAEYYHRSASRSSSHAEYHRSSSRSSSHAEYHPRSSSSRSASHADYHPPSSRHHSEERSERRYSR